jgi:3-dehydroquinate dehydratase type I
LMRPRICVAIPAYTLDQTLRAVKSVGSPDLIEIRLDYRRETIPPKAVRDQTSTPLIATNRCKSQGGYAAEDEVSRVRLVTEACEAGFEYGDVELSSGMLGKALQRIREAGSKSIVSCHDHRRTPGVSELIAMHVEAERAGADIVKLVGTVVGPLDNLCYLEYLSRHPGNVSFGMGVHGTLSRVMSPLVGGAFTYASAEHGEESASGQLTFGEMLCLYRAMGVEA